jgi:chromosomal replication initiation ATPase DnaA
MRSRVEVAVRMRPMSAKEHALGDQVAWATTATNIAPSAVVSNSGGTTNAATYTYDHVFDEHASNERVFEKFARPIINSSLQGYNGTMFAYGQTGSGKTHSISGSPGTTGLTTLALKRVSNCV